jgi:beta-lactamase class A
MGINEKEFYSPASLLKVPIMIAALKYAQNNSDFLLFEVPFTKPVEKPQKNTVGKFLELGQKYTVKQLLEYMIISSDNEAKYLLTQLVPINFQKGVYMDLGVDLYKNTNDEDFLSVKEYASYFRILYNASYLDKENSEYALSVLSQSAYKKGIVAGIPDNIVVSHKFGVRKINSRKFNIQLHDCGIVYKNNQPYLLCVMTRGTEFEYLEEVISKISRIVYNSLKSGD